MDVTKISGNKASSALEMLEPPDRLLAAVLGRINRERRRALFVWRTASLGAAAVFLAAFATAAAYSISALSQSGFGQYFSLLFSDGSALFGFWSEYLQSLAESLPLASLAACLLSLCLFLAALKFSAGHWNDFGRWARPV